MSNYCKLDRDRIHTILKEQDLKRWWVAECAGVHKTTLRRWLSGKIDRVHTRRVHSLATVLNVPDSDIAQR
jgi:hypothetical protein